MKSSDELHEKLARFYRIFRGHSYEDPWTENLWRQIEAAETREGVER